VKVDDLHSRNLVRGLAHFALLIAILAGSVMTIPRAPWRLALQVGLAEQGANSLLPAGGAGGLALGAWALHRGGMPKGHIARRTVAFGAAP
jgi:hypothetical protein